MKKIVRSAMVLLLLGVLCLSMTACDSVNFKGDFDKAATKEEVTAATDHLDFDLLLEEFNHKNVEAKMSAEGTVTQESFSLNIKLSFDFLYNSSTPVSASGSMKMQMKGTAPGTTIDDSANMNFYFKDNYAYMNGKQGGISRKYKQEMELDDLIGMDLDTDFEILTYLEAAMDEGVQVFLDEGKDTLKIRVLDEGDELIFVLKKGKLVGIKVSGGMEYMGGTLKMSGEYIATDKKIKFPKDLDTYEEMDPDEMMGF